MMSKTCPAREIQPQMGRRTHDEQDLPSQRDPTPAVQSQAASRQTTPVTPSVPQPPRETPMNRGEIPMEHRKRRVHDGAHENTAAKGDYHEQRRDPHGAQKKRVHHGAQQNIPCAAKTEAEKPQIQ